MADMFANKVILEDFELNLDGYDAISIEVTIYGVVLVRLKQYQQKKVLFFKPKTVLFTCSEFAVTSKYKNYKLLNYRLDNPNLEVIELLEEIIKLKEYKLLFNEMSLYSDYKNHVKTLNTKKYSDELMHSLVK